MPEPTTRKFTYSDYVTWPEAERWEIIDGEAFAMTPSPSPRHQRVAFRLAHLLESRLQNTGCTVYSAPLDVILSESDVVQPDVIVVCDQGKVTPRGIEGPPDVVIEVLSASTALRDRREKKRLYQRSGVSEYVLVDPEGSYVERFALKDDGPFQPPDVFGPEDVLMLSCLGVEIPLREVFESEGREALEPSES